jgi:hypothetical protein
VDINAEKIELASLILDTDDPIILRRVRAVFCNVDFNYDELPDHVKEDIKAGIKDIEEGRFISHEDVMRELSLKYKTNISEQTTSLLSAESATIKNEVESLAWSEWVEIPAPENCRKIIGPKDSGVYQIRTQDTKQNILFGIGDNCQKRMKSLFPEPYGSVQETTSISAITF